MFEVMIALGLFGALVWVIAHAIFLLMRNDANVGSADRAHDTIARFVAENYGPRFVPGDGLAETLRRL